MALGYRDHVPRATTLRGGKRQDFDGVAATLQLPSDLRHRAVPGRARTRSLGPLCGAGDELGSVGVPTQELGGEPINPTTVAMEHHISRAQSEIQELLENRRGQTVDVA
ncbi:MAG: hypothetical protein MJE77_25945 [Proteobacteria bacterium]|nr:hypothetical protein [Pseudomonadota bacterium]